MAQSIILQNTVDIETVQGDTRSFTGTFSLSDGTVVDITGYSLYVTIRKYYEPTDTTDSNALIALSWTAGDNTGEDPTNGIYAFTLTSAQTKLDKGTYKWDFQAKTPDGVITTVFRGDFTVVPEYTNRSS